MHRAATLPASLMVMLAVHAALASPPEALAHALADARALPVEKAKYTRYLDLTHLAGEARTTAAKVLAYHVNSLSREPEIFLPRPVAGGSVLAIDIRDYGWYGDPNDPKSGQFIYGRLGSVEAKEPYFHVVIEVTEGGKKVEKPASAPWLPPGQIAELIQLTGSQVPLLRGDWFYYKTALQENREGFGYYDFLRLGKKEADFFDLIGADAVKVKKLKVEMAASVVNSGVAINNRGITRTQSITGAYWFTADYKTSTNKQNVARLLAGDTVPPQGDASEQYGTLPNRLFAYWLQDKDGNRQNKVPQEIAPFDKRTTSNDTNIYAGTLSCTRCHVEGLRPIDDFVRKLYRGHLQLRSPDYDKLRKLRQLYGTDLPKELADDNVRFAAAVKSCNGLTVAENAAAVGQFWASYADDAVTPAIAARELGCTEAHLLGVLKVYVGNPTADPILAGFTHTPPLPMRRESAEELYPQMQQIIGAVP